jgi:hypothetical protein
MPAGDQGRIEGFPLAIVADGSGRYWVVTSTDPPMVFDRAGKFESYVGARGNGPGEFAIPVDVVPVTKDSVLIVDVGTQRATLVGKDLKPGPSYHLRGALKPSVAIQWPKLVVTSAQLRSSDAIGWPLHLLSFRSSEAQIFKSFGLDKGDLLPGREPDLQQVLAPSTEQRFWAADVSRYRVGLWSPNGTNLLTLERKPEWFPSRVDFGVGSPTTPPPPAVTALSEGSDRLLWVFTRVPSLHWRDAWPAFPQGTRSEIPVSEVAFEKFFRTMIEVIDPAAGRVMARSVFESLIVSAVAQDQVAAYSLDPDGYTVITVYRVRLRR